MDTAFWHGLGETVGASSKDDPQGVGRISAGGTYGWPQVIFGGSIPYSHSNPVLTGGLVSIMWGARVTLPGGFGSTMG